MCYFLHESKSNQKTHQTQCYVLRPYHCFIYEVGSSPSFGRDPVANLRLPLLSMLYLRIHTVRLIKQNYKNIVNNDWSSKTLHDEVKVKLDGEIEHHKSTGSRP